MLWITLDKHTFGTAHTVLTQGEEPLEIFAVPTSYDLSDFAESEVSLAFQHSSQSKISLSAFRTEGDVSLQVSSA